MSVISKDALALALCLALVGSSFPASATVPPGSVAYSDVALSEEPEYFRTQLLDFVHDMDDALALALANPAIGPPLAANLAPGSLQIPLPPEVYSTLERASYEELEQIRVALAAVPGALQAPTLLRLGLSHLPPPAVERATLAGCTDVYSDYTTIQSLTETARSVTVAKNSFVLLGGVIKMIWDSLNAAVATCESPIDIPLSALQIPAIVILGVAELVTVALDLTLNELSFSMVDADRCIHLTNCPRQGFTERFRPEEAPMLRGKGCDDRDNNCTNGIDEVNEDFFAPSVAIDAALTARCYRSEAAAAASAMLAVRYEDDCVTLAASPDSHEGMLDVQFTRSGCVGTLMATATDKRGNSSAANAFVAIDDAAPLIALQAPSVCQPTVEAARSAFGFGATDDCSGVRTDVRVVEKECVADFEFEAIDACGNRTTTRRQVRLDGAAPAVDIERLLLPAVDGRVCFASEPAAVVAVAEATEYRDNCTATPNLSFVTQAMPTGDNSCDRELQSTVVDSCGLEASDALVARLDGAPPTLSCTVATTMLDPPDGRWVDVGFALTVADDCGTADVAIEVAVTSDEPTSFQLDVKGADDSAPDARVEFGAGNVPRVLLRAERQQTESGDGRVYRIRSTATDGCGNRSIADCYVIVPKVKTANRADIVNSGQAFDATARN
jgi:hypothetical protein